MTELALTNPGSFFHLSREQDRSDLSSEKSAQEINLIKPKKESKNKVIGTDCKVQVVESRNKQKRLVFKNLKSLKSVIGT